MATVPHHTFRYRTRHRLILWKSLVGLVVAGSGLLTSYGHDNPLALAGAGALVALAVALFVLGRHGVALAIDDRGLRFGFAGTNRIPWSEIEAVHFRRIEGIGYLLVDRTAVARAAAPPGRWQQSLANRCKAADLVAPLRETIDDARQIHALVSMALSIARRGSESARR